jgi:hypothetical protein
MYCVVWEYEVDPSQVGEFLNAYGQEGAWVTLFRKDAAWLGTSLLRDVARADVFVSIDRWNTAEDYARFRARHAEVYTRIDAICDALTRRETRLYARP